MRSIDINSFEDICISNVTIVSGVRPAGRTIHILNAGRRYNGLLYIWDGEAHFLTQNNQSVCVKNGELLFIPKGLLYKMQYTAPSTTFVLANLDMIDKNGKDVLLSKELAVLARDDASNRIAKIMANLELCGSSQNLAALFRRKELVYKLLSAAYEIGAMSSLEDTRYPRIFAGVLLLEQSYLENLPVAKYAEASNMSISLFRTLFGKQYGMSPVQYRNRLRIERAATILSEGSCTVAEAAYACGFENIGYFCRYYKKITGETPQETKRRNT